MTVQWGDTGRVAFGTLKTFNISLASPRETLNGAPTSLPSTNPGSASAQAIFTIQQADLPTITPNPISVQYSAVVYIAGKNTDASSQSVSYQCYKNGATVSGATGSQSVATNTFWTQSHFRFNGVVVGDTLAVSVWCPSANVNFDYIAIQIYPTKVSIGKSYINKDVSYSYSNGTLTLGTPSMAAGGSCIIFPSTSVSASVSNTNAITFPAMGWNSTYNAFRLDWGDSTISTNLQTHATNRPLYMKAFYPSSISFREILR